MCEISFCVRRGGGEIKCASEGVGLECKVATTFAHAYK